MAKKKTTEIGNDINVSDLISLVESEFKKKFRDDSVVAFENNKREEAKFFYSTGIKTLDIALGGGLPAGKCSEFYGIESSGKSTTAYSCIAAAQQMYPDRIHILADPENNALDAQMHMEKLGVSPKGLLIIKKPDDKPIYAEDMFERLEHLFRNPNLKDRIGLVVIDSLGALVSRGEGDNDKKWDVGMRVGGMAQVLNMFIRNVIDNGVLFESNAHVLFLNQVRDNIGNVWEPLRVSGGRKLKHSVSQRVDVSRTLGQDFKNPDYVEGNPLKPLFVGQRIKYKITKNKINGREGSTANIDYYYDYGLDYYGNILKVAEHVGLMQGTTWKSLIDPNSGEVIAKHQGMNQWKQALQDDTTLWIKLNEWIEQAMFGSPADFEVQDEEE